MPIRPIKPAEPQRHNDEKRAEDSDRELLPPAQAEGSPDKKRRRGNATKDKDGKWRPTGERGFAAPPVEHQFKTGGKPGPGRPKGSVSQDALVKNELEQKRPVRIGGRERLVPLRHLIVMATIKDAIEGKSARARAWALQTMERLYPSEPHGPGSTPPDGDELSETGRAILDWFAGEIRAGRHEGEQS